MIHPQNYPEMEPGNLYVSSSGDSDIQVVWEPLALGL